MDNWMNEHLAAYNQSSKQMDEIYHQYAKRHGLSDTFLWLLYSLQEGDTTYTQRELCAIWHFAPQTLNSALKSMERQGYITLEPVSGNRKNKRVQLTAQGRLLSERVVLPLMQAEGQSLQCLSPQERAALLCLTQKYLGFLQDEINRIFELSSEDGSSQ